MSVVDAHSFGELHPRREDRRTEVDVEREKATGVALRRRQHVQGALTGGQRRSRRLGAALAQESALFWNQARFFQTNNSNNER